MRARSLLVRGTRSAKANDTGFSRVLESLSQTSVPSSAALRHASLSAWSRSFAAGSHSLPAAADAAAELGWEITPMAPALGATILGPDLTQSLISSKELDAIHAALVEYQVIFFRDQFGFSPANHRALASHFGPMQTHPAYPTVDDYPEITILENDRERPSLIEKWHTDMTFRPCPPLGSILHSKISPKTGGDTEFMSMAAAYDDLDASLKEKLLSLQAEHSFEHGFKESLEAPGGRERLAQALQDNPAVQHPVVRTHPISGRKALFVNCLFTTHIKGVDDQESKELLEFLFDHLNQGKYRCRFSWRPDSIAFWDNRITQHCPINDYWPQHRKLQRITIDGDRPF